MQKQTLIHNVLECDLQKILSMKALGRGTLKKGRKAYKPAPPHLNNPNKCKTNTKSLMYAKYTKLNFYPQKYQLLAV